MQGKRLTPQDLPPGVRVDAIPLPGGERAYLFTHTRLGPIGNMYVAEAGPAHSQISFEIAPGADPDSTAWGEQYELFRQVATICFRALPGSNGKAAVPPLEEVRTQQRLYRRFIQCQQRLDVLALAKQLTQPEYVQLLAAIETALITATPTDRLEIELRRGELQLYWADRQARPEG